MPEDVMQVVRLVELQVADEGSRIRVDYGRGASEAVQRLAETILTRLELDPATADVAAAFRRDPARADREFAEALTATLETDEQFKVDVGELMQTVEESAPLMVVGRSLTGWSGEVVNAGDAVVGFPIEADEVAGPEASAPPPGPPTIPGEPD